MSSIPTAGEFLSITQPGGRGSLFRLGRIDPSYSAGRPGIVFDGETSASLKKYPFISSYAPAANDRVLLCRVSGSYVILGRVI
jgi:hypothetical protein